MARDQQTIGGCPKCGSAEMICRYNRFDKEELRIESWEHRCPNCGYRETKAFRSDESNDNLADAANCPYCRRAANCSSTF